MSDAIFSILITPALLICSCHLLFDLLLFFSIALYQFFSVLFFSRFSSPFSPVLIRHFSTFFLLFLFLLLLQHYNIFTPKNTGCFLSCIPFFCFLLSQFFSLPFVFFFLKFSLLLSDQFSCFFLLHLSRPSPSRFSCPSKTKHDIVANKTF